MAVDANGISTLFNTLIDDIRNTLQKDLNEKRIDNNDYASFLGTLIAPTMELSVNTVVNDPLLCAQVATEEANKDSIKNKDDIETTQSSNDTNVKDAQKALIDNQATTEAKRADLIVRQKEGYDDNLKVEKGKMLSNVVGMFGGGGTAVPTDLETKMFNAVEDVYPGQTE